jgi:hypothetical protein
MNPSDEIGIETPSGFRRKADEIRNSWERLVASFPDDTQVKDIAREFETWHYQATKESSSLSQMFSSGELEKWQRRYATEYDRLTKANPSITTSAPRPTDIIPPDPPTKISPWVWAILAASGSIVVYSVYKMRE